MKASYLRVRLSFVEQEGNFSEKKDFFDYWSTKKGVNTITFQKCLNFDLFNQKDSDRELSEKELENKYKDEKPFFCSNPFETPVIREDGKIAPCGMPVRKENEDFLIGDISKGDKIKDCWNGPKMQKLREKHNNNKWYTENMCRICVKVLRSAQHEDFKIDSNK